MRRAHCAALLLALLCLGAPARAQNRGFQLNRYEPTAAGDPSLLVDRPWYSSTRYVAAGLTVNYAHNPLLGGALETGGAFTREAAIIEHQLLGHLDLAGSFLDRVLLTLSLPITLTEQGTARSGITPVGGVAVGDLRVGAMGRLYGHAERDPFSVHLGLSLWAPFGSLTGAFPPQVGESGVRVLPKLVLAGYVRHFQWAVLAGYYYRPEQAIGDLPPTALNSVGSALQLGAAVGYAEPNLRISAGPEVLVNTTVITGEAFTKYRTTLELLLGAHYQLGRLFHLSVGGGVGFLGEPGTPDGRVLFRAAYAPVAPARRPARSPGPDSDGDGIEDEDDACPRLAAGRDRDPRRRGCPRPRVDVDGDEDRDGVADSRDRCRAQPAGPHPDPTRPGCPDGDQDQDGVLDGEDQCRTLAAGAHPARGRRGCPDHDSDGDGVYDSDDQCKEQPAGARPDPARSGCPRAQVSAAGAELRAQAVAVVAEGLKSKARAVRLRALPGALTEASLRPQAQALLGDPELALPLIRLLAMRGVRAAAPDLERLLAQTQDGAVYVAAAAALAQLAPGPWRKRLQEASRAKDGPTRVRATLALSALDDPKARKALSKQAADAAGLPDDVYLQALGQLSRGGDARARERLRGVLASALSPSELRLQAAAELLGAGDEETRGRLRQMVSEGGVGRAVAARALAGQRDAEGCKVLAAVLRTETATPVQTLASEGLADCGGEADPQALGLLLSTPETPEELRVATAGALVALLLGAPGAGAATPAQALGTAPRLAALELVRQGLQSGDLASRRRALFGALAEPSLLPEALSRLSDPALQRTLVELIGQRRLRSAAPQLLALLDSTTDGAVFIATAEALALLDEPLGQKRLRESSKARDPTVKLQAAVALASQSDPKAASALKKLKAKAKSAPPEVHLRALGLLAGRGDSAAQSTLLQTLEAEALAPSLRVTAAAALLRANNPQVRPRLLQMLSAPGPASLVSALSLAEVADPAGCRALSALLLDDKADAASRLAAADGLPRCGPAADTLALSSLLSQPRLPQDLRLALAAALLQLGK